MRRKHMHIYTTAASPNLHINMYTFVVCTHTGSMKWNDVPYFDLLYRLAVVPASSLIHYSSVQCTGLEGRLTDCMMESSNVTACSHSDDVVVMCKQCKLFLFVHFVICHQAVHRKESGAYNIMCSDYTMNTEYCKTIQLFVSCLLFNEHLILFIIPRHCPTITNIQLTNQISKKLVSCTRM